jgi:hypothetical protein
VILDRGIIIPSILVEMRYLLYVISKFEPVKVSASRFGLYRLHLQLKNWSQLEDLLVGIYYRRIYCSSVLSNLHIEWLLREIVRCSKLQWLLEWGKPPNRIILHGLIILLFIHRI